MQSSFRTHCTIRYARVGTTSNSSRVDKLLSAVLLPAYDNFSRRGFEDLYTPSPAQEVLRLLVDETKVKQCCVERGELLSRRVQPTVECNECEAIETGRCIFSYWHKLKPWFSPSPPEGVCKPLARPVCSVRASVRACMHELCCIDCTRNKSRHACSFSLHSNCRLQCLRVDRVH